MLDEISILLFKRYSVEIHVINNAENIEFDSIKEFEDHYKLNQEEIKKVVFVFNNNINDQTIAVTVDFDEKSFSIILILDSIEQNLKIEEEIKSLVNVKGVYSEGKQIENVLDGYIDIERLKELKNISAEHFDLTRLIRYCEELNIVASYECNYSTIMVLRAMLDHVPPIFNKKSFIEVANSHPKSIKDSLLNLENSSRKIADAALHLHIRRTEILPNKTQVNFKNDLDVLLSEIVRILK